ncbi:hypothetical protein AB4124_06165 [Paenibacillus sp. 2KB_20]|uniref:hypothetical protein n=1 Tax=Paenibacillus sp. 2KB_20 TaxID=3232977 RepID=UPI003F966EAB
MQYKYAVVKIADIDTLLLEVDRKKMYQLLNIINDERELLGKGINSYIVVNTDEPYATEIVEILKRNGHWGTERNELPEGLTISRLVEEAHRNAVEKGWWDEDCSFGEIISLIHSEASEALEDYRNGRDITEVWYENKELKTRMNDPITPNCKPCGIPSELADIVIRVFDVCGRHGIDLETAIREKMAYNATRPQRHGGKKL